MFTAYLQARSTGDSKLETFYVRRFAPDYRVAFLAWLKTGPFTNPDAPAGPGYMRQYRNPSFESAARLNALAMATFNQGTAARYLRDTVLFASVLFLVAVAQRFKAHSVSIATTAVAFGLAAYTTVAVLTLPRI